MLTREHRALVEFMKNKNLCLQQALLFDIHVAGEVNCIINKQLKIDTAKIIEEGREENNEPWRRSAQTISFPRLQTSLARQ